MNNYVDILDYIVYYFEGFLDELENDGKSFQIVKQSLSPETKQNFILLRLVSDITSYRPEKKQTISLQVLIQATGHDEQARETAIKILELIPEQYGDIILSAPDGRESKDISVALIRPVNGPNQIGNVGDGLYQYSVNYTIIHGEC